MRLIWMTVLIGSALMLAFVLFRAKLFVSPKWSYLGGTVALGGGAVDNPGGSRKRFKLLKRAFSFAIYGLFNVVLGAVLLYATNLAEPFTNIYIGINYVTVFTVGILGIPGLFMLGGMKLLFA